MQTKFKVYFLYLVKFIFLLNLSLFSITVYSSELTEYIVKKGDTVSLLTRKLNISEKKLIQLNRIKNFKLIIGQKIILPSPLMENTEYTVKKGDSLSLISLKFDVPVSDISQWNSLVTENLKMGQTLKLKADVKSEKPRVVTIIKGDSLWRMANKYNCSVDDLKSINKLDNDSLVINQKIIIPESNSPEKLSENITKVPAPLIKDRLQLASFKLPSMGYSSTAPSKNSQDSKDYFEEYTSSSFQNYNMAVNLLNKLDTAIAESEPLSDKLKGIAVVIDPGHGGLDPGAIIKAETGNRKTVYVVEDEYVYDISLRLYTTLKRHGADVFLTIISPNHLIRSNETPLITFVNQKNEVYNNKDMNKMNTRLWPIGTRSGLKRRIDTAEPFINEHIKNNEKTLWISLHADNSIGFPAGSGIFIDKIRDHNETTLLFAENIRKAMGQDSYIKARDLRVLKENPLEESILVEVRNLSIINHAWAIRLDELRQQDAEKLCNGIISYYQQTVIQVP